MAKNSVCFSEVHLARLRHLLGYAFPPFRTTPLTFWVSCMGAADYNAPGPQHDAHVMPRDDLAAAVAVCLNRALGGARMTFGVPDNERLLRLLAFARLMHEFPKVF